MQISPHRCSLFAFVYCKIKLPKGLAIKQNTTAKGSFVIPHTISLKSLYCWPLKIAEYWSPWMSRSCSVYCHKNSTERECPGAPSVASRVLQDMVKTMFIIAEYTLSFHSENVFSWEQWCSSTLSALWWKTCIPWLTPEDIPSWGRYKIISHHPKVPMLSLRPAS